MTEAVEKIPSTTPESNQTLFRYPYIFKYIDKLFNHTLSEDELLEFFSKKNPNTTNPGESRYLPRSESILHALRSVNNPSKFIQNLTSCGLVGTYDGVKISDLNNVNGAGRHVSDSIIISNMELLLQTASELNIEILPPNYSGDEGAFMMAPLNPADFDNDRRVLQTRFDAKLKENAKVYYSNPYFAAAKSYIESQYPGQSIGLTINYADPVNVSIYTPTRYEGCVGKDKMVPHIKQVMGAIIDAATGNIPMDPDSSMTLNDFLTNSLTQNLDLVTQNKDLENLFPKELLVKKIATMESDVNTWQQTRKNEDLYMIRFADIFLKLTNKMYSHTKGDHQMIAVANMFIRLTRDFNIKRDKVNLYQHNGSMLATMDKDTYDNIAKIFNDPISLNTYFKEAEINREKLAGQNHNLRADPFIVATTQIRDGNGALTSPIIGKDNLWDLVETLQKNSNSQ
jgi:hypothetical protein